MKEVRPTSTGRSEIRILCALYFLRTVILLLGADKAGRRDISWQLSAFRPGDVG